jgi:hypothetical protein
MINQGKASFVTTSGNFTSIYEENIRAVIKKRYRVFVSVP